MEQTPIDTLGLTIEVLAHFRLQGIKEFFVRDVWKDCQAVSEYVNRFQSAKRAIAGIMEAATRVRLICVDKKNTRELDGFLCQQAEVQKDALNSLQDHYNEIVGNILNIQEVCQRGNSLCAETTQLRSLQVPILPLPSLSPDSRTVDVLLYGQTKQLAAHSRLQLFKEQNKDVQREWTAFIDKMDLEWREALRKIARISLQVNRNSQTKRKDEEVRLRVLVYACLQIGSELNRMYGSEARTTSNCFCSPCFAAGACYSPLPKREQTQCR